MFSGAAVTLIYPSVINIFIIHTASYRTIVYKRFKRLFAGICILLFMLHESVVCAVLIGVKISFSTQFVHHIYSRFRDYLKTCAIVLISRSK